MDRHDGHRLLLLLLIIIIIIQLKTELSKIGETTEVVRGEGSPAFTFVTASCTRSVHAQTGAAPKGIARVGLPEPGGHPEAVDRGRNRPISEARRQAQRAEGGEPGRKGLGRMRCMQWRRLQGGVRQLGLGQRELVPGRLTCRQPRRPEAGRVGPGSFSERRSLNLIKA